METQKAVLQVRWVKSQWRFPSPEPRIYIVSQLEHREYTGEKAAHTCKRETECSPEVCENNDSHREAFGSVLGVTSCSPGNVSYKYCEWQEVCGDRNGSLEKEIYLVRCWLWSKGVKILSQKGRISLRVRGSLECCHFTAGMWQRRFLHTDLKFHAIHHGV